MTTRRPTPWPGDPFDAAETPGLQVTPSGESSAARRDSLSDHVPVDNCPGLRVTPSDGGPVAGGGTPSDQASALRDMPSDESSGLRDMPSDELRTPRVTRVAATPAPRVPSSDVLPGDGPLGERLADAVTASDAPDVVFALSRHGRRTVLSGGTGPPPPLPREDLRYEIGSATKTFTGLLLARLIHDGRLSGGEPATAFLDGGRPAGEAPVTLAHLITHTSGLPALPAGFFLRGLPAWHTNPYARFPAARVVDAFLRHRPRHRPGTRWRYSNYGVAVLGHALAAATGTPWEDLLTDQVLRPLGLNGTTLRADDSGFDALGHGKDGESPVPAFDAGGFQAAGAVRATPHDLLTFLEDHLAPAGAPPRAGRGPARGAPPRAPAGHRAPARPHHRLVRSPDRRRTDVLPQRCDPRPAGVPGLLPRHRHGSGRGVHPPLPRPRPVPGHRVRAADRGVAGPARRRRHVPRRRRTALTLRHTRCHRAGVRVGAHAPCAWWVCRHR